MKEQQANKLWAGFDPEKENKKFWRKYEALLQKHRQTRVKAANLPKTTESRKKYFPSLWAYLWRTFISFFGFAIFWVTVEIIFISSENFGFVPGVFAIGFTFVFGIITPILYWAALHVFSVSQSGIQIKRVGSFKEKYFAWEKIRSVRIEEKYDNRENRFHTVLINCTTGEKQCFRYNLSRKCHYLLKEAIEEQSISFFSSSNYY